MIASLVILALLVIPLQIAAQNVTTVFPNPEDHTPIESGATLQLWSTFETAVEAVDSYAEWEELGETSANYNSITMYFRPEADQDLQMTHKFEARTGQTRLVVWVEAFRKLSVVASFSVDDPKQRSARISAPLNDMGGIVAIDFNFSKPLTPQAASPSATTVNERLVTAALRTAHETLKFDRSFAVQMGERVQVNTVHYADVKLFSRRQLHTWVSAKTLRLPDQEQRMRPSAVRIQAILPRGQNVLCSRQDDIESLNLQLARPQ